MRKFWILILVPLYLLTGCGVASLNTNLPFFYGHRMEITNASDYDLTVQVNGAQQKFEFRDEDGNKKYVTDRIKTGKSVIWKFRNWNTQPAETLVTVKAWVNGDFVGVYSGSLTTHNGANQAEAWVFRNEHFDYDRRGANWRW